MMSVSVFWNGEVAERLKAAVLKTVESVRAPGGEAVTVLKKQSFFPSNALPWKRTVASG